MTTRKRIRLSILVGLCLLMAVGLAGTFVTWGPDAWWRLELWLCLLGIAGYLWRGIWLVLRKRGESLLGDLLETNLVCTAIYMLILEYWVFPMQLQMSGGPLPEETVFRLVGRAIPFAILLGWILLGKRGAGSVKTLLPGGLVPLGYLVGSVIWVTNQRHHPYFFFDAMMVGGRGVWEWLMEYLLLLPLVLLGMAAAEYALSMIELWYTPIRKRHKQNIKEGK